MPAGCFDGRYGGYKLWAQGLPGELLCTGVRNAGMWPCAADSHQQLLGGKCVGRRSKCGKCLGRRSKEAKGHANQWRLQERNLQGSGLTECRKDGLGPVDTGGGRRPTAPWGDSFFAWGSSPTLLQLTALQRQGGCQSSAPEDVEFAGDT